MIIKLKIVNFILTDELVVNFCDGLNVLTGETGAGKSIIVGSLDFILGKQVRSDLFYDKSKPVYLEATFDLKHQETRYFEDKVNLINTVLGFSITDESKMVISKEISLKGKPLSYVNGNRINQKQLYEIRSLLIDFHSQREQLQLFNEQYQLEILDLWSGLVDLRQEYTDLFFEIKNLRERKSKLEKEEKQSLEKNLLYEYQIEELERLDLDAEEEKRINLELDLLTNSEEILAICSEIQQTCVEQDNSLMDVVSGYQQRLQRISQDNENIKNINTSLAAVGQMLNDIQSEARILEDSIDLDQSRMEELEDRLNEIIKIKNKYKKEVPGILKFLGEMKTALVETGSRKNEIDNLSKEITLKTEKLWALADLLSEERKKGADGLAKEIIKDFAGLSIPDGFFSVDITTSEKRYTANGQSVGLSETGKDKVDFLFSANKGQAPQSLKSVVSGGELSRLLLIIKKLLAGRSDSPTLVLDEIDTGIGGKTATNIGKYISQIANHHQVVCITHLPQIASFAEKQFLIKKPVTNGKPLIRLKELSYEERREEIARMLSGTKSDIALQHADEILNNN